MSPQRAFVDQCHLILYANRYSELIATGAPNKFLLDTLSTLYDLLLAAFGTGLWLRHRPGLHAYWRYSLLSLLLVFVSGGLGAAAIAMRSPYLGLVERVTIGAYIQWVFVLALKLASAASALERPVTPAERLAG
jgi:hypothetical protein